MFEIVAAIDANGGIGYRGDLPWPRIPQDMRFFKSLTLGGSIIMGRKTRESLFAELPGRVNLVISRQRGLYLQDAIVSANKDTPGRVYVIGGGEVYREVMYHPECKALYITKLESAYDCDVFMPEFIPLCQDAPVVLSWDGGCIYKISGPIMRPTGDRL